ncbi:MAG: CBS domain-containing protein [Burkholderiales bacterium]|nr:CBS domain-containing protein [Burkholderiales bacterium]
MTNRPIAYIVKDQKPEVLSNRQTVQEACKRMSMRRIGAVLVTGDDHRLCGIFTGRDAVRALSQAKDPTVTALGEVMTPNPVTIAPDRTAIDALRLLCDGGFRHLPVVREHNIVGIVSRGDFKGMELDRLEGETALWERIG